MKAGARHFYISNLPPSRAQTVLSTILEKARTLDTGGRMNGRGRGIRLSGCSLDGFDDGRQANLDRGPGAGRAGNPDVAAALLHDAINGRQAEAGAFADWLRREERLEHPRARRLVHPCAGVRHRQRHIAAWHHVRDTARRRPASEIDARRVSTVIVPASGIASTRIHDQVHDDLIELPRVELHRSMPDQIEHQHDPRRHQTAEHRMDRAQRVIEVQHPRLQHLPAAECEQLLRERGGAIRPPSSARRAGRGRRRLATHWRSSVRSAHPMMTVSRLLKSCAMPPASCPTASSRWAWRSCSSRSFCPVRSMRNPRIFDELAGLVEFTHRLRQHRHDAAVAAAERQLARHQPAVGAKLFQDSLTCLRVGEERRRRCGARFSDGLESEQ